MYRREKRTEEQDTQERGTGFKRVLFAAFWLLVWQVMAVLVDNELLLVTPFEAFRVLVGFLDNVDFWQTIAMSFLRILAGLTMGVMVGILLAGASYRFETVENLIKPLMNLLKTIPVVSFVVLLLIWWGASFLSVSICFLIVFPYIYVSTLEGLKNTPKELLEMAQVFGISAEGSFFYIYRPALRPFLNSGLSMALGMCWKSGVAAEVIGTPAFSIGEKLYLSKIYLDTGGIFAWTAVIIILSILFEKLCMRLSEFFFEWEPSVRKPRRAHYDRLKIGGERGTSADVRKSRNREADGSGKAESGKADRNWNQGKGRSRKRRTENKALVCKGICKTYGEKVVLEQFQETFPAGEISYLTWPSGQGKTTLFRLLAGLEQADSGTIQVPARCAMLFQEDRLCMDYSALKNVELVTGDREAGRKALLQLLAQEELERPCSQLSGGQRRRVALVRTMEAEADFVLLDEPFTGMDADTRERAQRYIKEKQQGRTMLIATHLLH